MAPCTIVIKLGTSSIVHEESHQPLLSTLSSVVETVVHLRNQGHKVVLVSSGAIGVGLKRMNIPSKPKSLSGKQALAAIGQGRLIALWDDLFSHLEQPIAQILLTRGDISDRTRYLNAVNTFRELLSMGVVPIVNENDTISVSEIKFGDNDTLSAITSSMIHADYLFLLTDVDGLYTANPRKDPSVHLIEVVTSIPAIRSRVSTTTLGSSLGTGGMETKIIAAEIATGAGASTIITSSKRPENIFSILEYHSAQKPSSPTIPQAGATLGSPAEFVRPPHTIFMPSPNPMTDMKSWTAHTLSPAGSLVIDGGAHRVLSRRESGGRLLPVGVIGVIGAFASGQAVRILIMKEPGSSSADVQEASYSAHSTRPSSPAGQGESAALSRSVSSGDLTTQIEEDFLSEDDVVEVGRGLANYNYVQISQVKGRNSSYIAKVLGYADSEYVAENITIRLPPA
ncbi:glutamate 5-kinase [Marasmius fiardii PR-910]|nr:glutamate 5-kinase [Marasmius fiardii PR-910]